MTHQLPDLPYDVNALEPHFDARTMEIHHGKHHAGYVAKLNAAVAGTPVENTPLIDLISNLSDVPEEIRTSVRNNGGGHFNHSLFWACLSGKETQPSDALSAAVDRDFGSMELFKKKFADAAATRFGSGWAWLGLKNGTLCVCSTPNQDNPLMKEAVACNCTPILGLDVWEHAYYLSYQNRRPDYIDAFWSIVNWDQVSKNYSESL